eukprot:scaffold3836_cov417-Prasinococcus_capsulatus_cf.AAC.3
MEIVLSLFVSGCSGHGRQCQPDPSGWGARPLVTISTTGITRFSNRANEKLARYPATQHAQPRGARATAGVGGGAT